MKKNIRKIGSGLLAVMILMLAGAVFSEPGSNKDPLVSLSYVDKKMDELKSYIDLKVKDVDKKVENMGSKVDEEDNRPPQIISNNVGPELEVLELEKGQKLIGEKGTEIILRSGNAVVIGSKSGGLSDVTGGKDIKNGVKISKNHLLIVPRDDGRGIYSNSGTFIMVRGSYSIE